MTVIAYRDGILAADTAAWCEDIISGHAKKIRRLSDGTLFAAMGSTEFIEPYLRWRMEGGEKPPSPEKDDDFCGIIVGPGRDRVRWLGRSYEMYPASAALFHVLGAHNEFLRGAMAAGASAEEAVRLAIEYCGWAAGEVQVERLS